MSYTPATGPVSVGLGIAALLFLRKMAVLTEGNVRTTQDHPSFQGQPLPKDVLLYEIAGPMFFGAAQRAVGSLNAIHDDVKFVIVSLEKVPVMDMTGLVALENTIERLSSSNRRAVLVGLHGQAQDLVQKSQVLKNSPSYRTVVDALMSRDQS